MSKNHTNTTNRTSATPLVLTRRGFTLAAMSSAVLAACGGGGGGVAGISTGGTGSFSSGTVRGFGSIIVNGVRYDDSRASVFGDDGVTALAAALTKGSWGSLRLITLHDTATTDRGGKALSNAAKDGYLPKLTFLNLSGTDVQASTKDHIMASYAYFSCSVL